MAAVDPQPAIITRATLESVYGEPAKEQQKPPHHLLETQIFPNLQKNDVFQIEPEQLSFVIQHSVKSKKVHIVNTSSLRQNFHVIEPLNTKLWTISYEKPTGGLVPGGTVDITVKFHPSSNAEGSNICQDSIRIHCNGGNLLIPLYAYPTIDASDFPSKINFGSIPLGQESTRTIKLHAAETESFEYSCTMHPPSNAFDIKPAFGTISGEHEISVSYSPTEFVTSSANLQIIFSTFDRKMLKCKISGNCLPGLLTLKKKREFALQKRDKQPVSKHKMARETSEKLARLARDQATRARKKVKPKEAKPIPKILPGAQHHINKLLNVSEKNDKKKETHDQLYIDRSKVFREKLRQVQEAEKVNKLRWQIRIGDEVPSFDQLHEVREERKSYTDLPIGDRTEREANSKPSFAPNFDPYRNSPWRARHIALGQFQQAARTILIRFRAEDRLSKLRKLMKLVNGDGYCVEEAETILLAQMGRQIQRKANPAVITPNVQTSSSSATIFAQYENGPMQFNSGDITLPPSREQRISKATYYKTVTGDYVKEQGYTCADPYSRVDSTGNVIGSAEESYGTGGTEGSLIHHLRQLKIRSREAKMTYSEILAMINPNKRLTQSDTNIQYLEEIPSPKSCQSEEELLQNEDSQSEILPETIES